MSLFIFWLSLKHGLLFFALILARKKIAGIVGRRVLTGKNFLFSSLLKNLLKVENSQLFKREVYQGSCGIEKVRIEVTTKINRSENVNSVCVVITEGSIKEKQTLINQKHHGCIML